MRRKLTRKQLLLINEIVKLWKKCPEERWGQFMFNRLLDSHFEKVINGNVIEDPFFTSDDDYLKHLKKLNL